MAMLTVGLNARADLGQIGDLVSSFTAAFVPLSRQENKRRGRGKKEETKKINLLGAGS